MLFNVQIEMNWQDKSILIDRSIFAEFKRIRKGNLLAQYVEDLEYAPDQ